MNSLRDVAPAGEPPCPICLARGTRIATPIGEVAVEDVRPGMRVWSIDGAGNRVEATVVLIGQTHVPASHEVVRLALDDGRVLRASPGHPLVDGRLLTTVRPGDRVDGATVLSAALESYSGGSTFDILTDSPSGGYIADRIPLGSTLADALISPAAQWSCPGGLCIMDGGGRGLSHQTKVTVTVSLCCSTTVLGDCPLHG